jgi:hypothetical protein
MMGEEEEPVTPQPTEEESAEPESGTSDQPPTEPEE